jgi:transposase
VDKLAVISYARKKLSPEQIAKIVGGSEAAVKKVIAEAVTKGALPAAADEPKRLSQEDRKARRKKVADFVAKGKTIREAADEFGISETQVSNACREFSVQPKRAKVATFSPKGLSQFNVLSLLIDGLTERAVAEHLGISVQYVNSVAVKARQDGVFRAIDRAMERIEKASKTAAKK